MDKDSSAKSFHDTSRGKCECIQITSILRQIHHTNLLQKSGCILTGQGVRCGSESHLTPFYLHRRHVKVLSFPIPVMNTTPYADSQVPRHVSQGFENLHFTVGKLQCFWMVK